MKALAIEDPARACGPSRDRALRRPAGDVAAEAFIEAHSALTAAGCRSFGQTMTRSGLSRRARLAGPNSGWRGRPRHAVGQVPVEDLGWLYLDAGDVQHHPDDRRGTGSRQSPPPRGREPHRQQDDLRRAHQFSEGRGGNPGLARARGGRTPERRADSASSSPKRPAERPKPATRWVPDGRLHDGSLLPAFRGDAPARGGLREPSRLCRDLRL